MDKDPYEILGVQQSDSAGEIQKAYRRLAKKLHPDLNPGNREAEEEFKKVASAYDLLSDPEKRARFDRGEIDASGAERPQHQFYRDYAGAGAEYHPYATDAGYADMMDSDEILSNLFRGARTRGHADGRDVQYKLPVEFLAVVNGATSRVILPDGSALDVVVPAGTRDGQILRLRGKGEPGLGGGKPGDALVEIDVKPHRFFAREGDDIHITLPVSLSEAILGAEVRVPSTTGVVSMRLPKGANTGRVLRLKGKGVVRPDGSRGDQYVNLKVVLPDKIDPELEAFVTNWAAGKAENPRAGMERRWIDRQQFLVRTRLEIETLEVWIKEEWLIPREDATGQEFSDADIARAHLIKDLKQDFGVNDEGIGVILNLIDQVHGLRRTLRDLLQTVRNKTDS